MQVDIKVTVGVNSELHAEIIAKDIARTIRERTTIYFVGKPCGAEESVAKLWEGQGAEDKTWGAKVTLS